MHENIQEFIIGARLFLSPQTVHLKPRFGFIKEKMMQWLTISQIKRRSKTAKGALKVSYEHWNQLYKATAEELRREYKKSSALVLSNYCGLCIYYKFMYGKTKKCSKCPLSQGDIHKRCGGRDDLLWFPANDTLSDWINKRGSWQAWKRACKELRDKLKELMDA